MAPRGGNKLVDGFGLYTGGSRIGANIYVRWPFMQGDAANVLRLTDHSYKCGGDIPEFELLKVPTMSTLTPPATILASLRVPALL